MKYLLILAVLLCGFICGSLWHKSWYTPKTYYVSKCKDGITYVYFTEEEANKHGAWIAFNSLNPKWEYRRIAK